MATDHSKILAYIALCDDAEKLKSLLENARERNETTVADAAFRRLISVLPTEEPGTLEHDFWQTIHAFEHILTDEREKTTRLSRTRQKVARVGVEQTLKDWALGTAETDGFKMLIERGLPELTGEAIVLRHSGRFETEPEVVVAARQRLLNAGVNISTLIDRTPPATPSR
jgi:hypothetical protein